MSVLFTRRGEPPAMGKRLSDYAEGDIVKLNENGTPVEFYVAKHDYESSLNGTGRTLLVRKECHSPGAWSSSGSFDYSSSDIDSALNGIYKGMFDAEVQNAIETTKFYYRGATGQIPKLELSRSVFILSTDELGVSVPVSMGSIGSTLPIATTLKKATCGGSGVTQWTRSIRYDSTQRIYGVSSTGNYTQNQPTSEGYARPCITLSGGTLFDPDTNEFLEVK